MRSPDNFDLKYNKFCASEEKKEKIKEKLKVKQDEYVKEERITSIIKLALNGVEKEISIEKLSVDEISSVVGKLRFLGFSAQPSSPGNIIIQSATPKEKDSRISKAENFLRKSKDKPIIFPTSHVYKDAYFLKYRGIHTKIVSGVLWISNAPISLQTVKSIDLRLKDLIPSDLRLKLDFEMEFDYSLPSIEDAKKTLVEIKSQLGECLLIEPKQLGRTISFKYKFPIPESLPVDYPKKTITAWAGELSNQIGTGGAYIAYNKYMRSLARKEVSLADFSKIIK